MRRLDQAFSSEVVDMPAHISLLKYAAKISREPKERGVERLDRLFISIDSWALRLDHKADNGMRIGSSHARDWIVQKRCGTQVAFQTAPTLCVFLTNIGNYLVYLNSCSKPS